MPPRSDRRARRGTPRCCGGSTQMGDAEGSTVRPFVHAQFRAEPSSMKKAVRLALCGGVLLAACHLEVGLLARAASRDVIVVPIQGTVDDGMAHLGRARRRRCQRVASRGAGPRYQHDRGPRQFGVRDPRRAVPRPGADRRLCCAACLLGRGADHAVRAEDRDGPWCQHSGRPSRFPRRRGRSWRCAQEFASPASAQPSRSDACVGHG